MNEPTCSLLNKFALLMAITALTPLAQSQTVPPITGTLQGTREAIFQTPQDSCIMNDIPDAMARAFRDAAGTIHLAAASSTLFESLGPSLDALQHSCSAAYISAGDPNPADFDDQVWLDSFYTLDGKNIAALAHTEYHGWSHTGECKTQNISECEYDSDTFHVSHDGGYHFNAPQAPANFLAGTPFQYEIDRGPMGYSVDSNVIHYNGWYYAVATDWTWPPNCTEQGPRQCLVPGGGAPIRTTDVFDPSSWRAWGGSDFSISFADPYLGAVSDPKQHVCVPVQYMAYINAVNIYKNVNIVVATLWDYWDDTLGTPGLYLTTSTDLVNWTTPTLVVTVQDLMAMDPPGNWLYAYFSLIDPDAADFNFETIGDQPYVYFVRLNTDDVYERTLFRQKVQLRLNR
jgi:hypothetical protein